MARVLEVCVDSVESAVSAARGGAMRLELCANLVIGGTSPDEDLFRMVRRRVDIPIRVLLRPRFGDFLYSEEEFELLRRQVRRLGGDTILTSGRQASCTEGAALLRELVGRSGGRPQILVGAGVNADVIRALQPMTGADAFHLSAKRTENSRMTYRREGVPMGLPGISEFEVCAE